MRNLLAIHIRADNDRNGNPRRCFLIYEQETGEYLGAIDEGYRGDGALAVLGEGNPIRDGDRVRILARIPTAPAFVRQSLREARS